MQTKTTLLAFALLAFAAAAAACDATPPDSFRDFEGGTGGESGSDTGGLDIICVSDEDGVTAEREYGEGCPMDYTLGCVASEYPDPTSGAACCKLFEESNCHMNWGESTCPTGFVRVCTVEALGNGDGDGDTEPAQVCGTSTGSTLYVEEGPDCEAPGTFHYCYVGDFNGPGADIGVCCDGGQCDTVAITRSCDAGFERACDTIAP
jgi:hypothetical protein